MNQIRGKIIDIQTADALSLVHVEAGGVLFSTVVIDTPETAGYLQPGRQVTLVFKETEVAIGKGISGGLSIRNRLPTRLESMKTGKILTQLTLTFGEFRVQSLITTAAAQALDLQPGEAVEALIKTHAISLTPV